MRTYQRGFEQNSIITIVTFILLYIMVFFALEAPLNHLLFSWPSILIYLVIMGGRFWMLFNGQKTTEDYKITQVLIYAGAIFWSINFGLGLMMQPSIQENLLIIIFLMGIGAAGAIGLSKDSKLTVGFLLSLFVPSAIFSFIYLDKLNLFIGLAFGMYCVYLIFYSNKYYRISQENIAGKLELQHQKEALEDHQKLLTIQNQQLEETLSKAKMADKAKSLFLANMSHEIRTPLNGIIGMSHLLKQTEMNGDQYKKVSIIEFSAETLVSLVNDILDFSKIEAGKLELDLDHFNLHEVINNTCELFVEKSKEKKLEFHCEISPEVPVFVYSDEIRIKQILINLINNAIKFTNEGGIDVYVKCENKTEEGVFLKFEVIDSGIGISKENQDKLFSAFTQSDASFTRKFGGTGLGLAISKKLSLLLGGGIGLESELGKGSNFWFTISVEKGKEKVLLEDVAKVRISKSLQILLAEDNKINVLVAKQMIENAGHRVVVANNGMEAVECFQQQEFDLILMDIMMPEMDGLEATWIIRQMEREKNTPNIPIIALTANVVREDQEKYISAGMNDFISKPIHPQILLEKIEKLFQDSE